MDENSNELMTASRDALGAGASSGNPFIAGGIGTLSFIAAMQARKQREKEMQMKKKMLESDLLNSALDRYMQAVQS